MEAELELNGTRQELRECKPKLSGARHKLHKRELMEAELELNGARQELHECEPKLSRARYKLRECECRELELRGLSQARFSSIWIS